MSVKRKNTDKYTVQSLAYLISQGKIWLNPEYQRGAVWTKSQEQLLVDSLLNDKILHLLLSATLTDIKPNSIKKTYQNNVDITESNPQVKRLKKAFRFLCKAFKKHPNPRLKKYSMITLGYLVVEMLEKYNLGDFSHDVGKCFLEFEKRRIENEELPEDKQDSALAGYTDAARADSVADLTYRHEYLERQIILCLPEMALKDEKRGFSGAQRLAVYIRDGGKCKQCGIKCSEAEYHVDHIKAHAKGGKTKLSNAQLLCPKHNLEKGKKEL